MKLGVILYLLGKISLGMGLVQLVPLVMSIYYEEQGTAAFLSLSSVPLLFLWC